MRYTQRNFIRRSNPWLAGGACGLQANERAHSDQYCVGHPSAQVEKARVRHRERGQALVFVALVLTFVLMLALTAIEIGARYQQLAAIEDALQQATRSSVQSFDYAAFAAGSESVREPGPAAATGCADLAPYGARRAACDTLLANLQTARGLEETPAQTAARVTWTFLPQGGDCVFPNGRPPITFSGPAVCATLRPRMTGLLGWGVWTPQIDAADAIDRS